VGHLSAAPFRGALNEGVSMMYLYFIRAAAHLGCAAALLLLSCPWSPADRSARGEPMPSIVGTQGAAWNRGDPDGLTGLGWHSNGRSASTQCLARFDFAGTSDVQGWRPVHDVDRLQGTAEGLLIQIGGDDPYIHGPARDYPTGKPLWLSVRLKVARSGVGQVFFFTATRGANEADSVRFLVRGGEWQEVRVPLPPLGPGYSLRLDPPGGKGDEVVVSMLSIEARPQLEEPAWPLPTTPLLQQDALLVGSGDVELIHNRGQWGGFIVRVAGQPMAAGLARSLIGYALEGDVRWIDLAERARVTVQEAQDAVVVEARARDVDGADWLFRQEFRPNAVPGALDVPSQVSVSQARNVVYLPMFTILPGLGSFGEAKNQALFAGLEYLGQDEPSSSEADIVGPGSQRQVPDTLKITIPLMAVQANDRYVGLIWDKQPRFCAVFDSPDRLFKSRAHVIGIIFPGSDGTNRVESSLLPYAGQTLNANEPLTLRATLIGGRAQSIVPAIQQYVALRGLPPIPQAGVQWDRYLVTAATGWLDSAIRVDGRYRHAWPGSFAPQPAADAAMMMDWLALQTDDIDLRGRLRSAARGALAEVRAEESLTAAVSHVRSPAPALVYGHAAVNAARARQAARHLLTRFEPDGSLHFRKSSGGRDFGKTHFAPDANGLTARAVAAVLEAAMFSGDDELTDQGLRVLRALGKFANTVPRGAQTWEIPLHTPDILASALLVRAYTLGYELTGDAHFLEQAQNWAWTGVPFVYLVPPTTEPIGLYGTIPVLGATNWVAPNWMGLPVQWCGLVYADAIYYLARHDRAGPWSCLADGITASGVQQIWPVGSDAERQGLLPDSFALRAQVRQDAAINPGTVLANAVRLFDRPALYDCHVFRNSGLIVHAPGAIRGAQDEPGRVTFTVDAWPDHAYQVLIVGLKTIPRLAIDNRDTPLTGPHHFDEEEGWLILTLDGRASISMEL
jgi:hypothetical protein